MGKEIIISRKKTKSLKIAFGLFLATILLLFPIIIYFVDISWVTTEIPLVVVILSMFCAPLCFFCAIWYFKQIYNNKPVLIVNEIGIHEEMNSNSVGMIRWEDIENINIIPYMGNTYFICILLKEPEKYILNQKLLNKLNKQKSTQKWGHIKFSSIYFKSEFKEIIELINYYFAKCNDKII